MLNVSAARHSMTKVVSVSGVSAHENKGWRIMKRRTFLKLPTLLGGAALPVSQGGTLKSTEGAMCRMPIKLGMIFQIPTDTEPEYMKYIQGRMNGPPLAPGDFLMTVQHSGDCYYDFALLKEEDGNEWTRYFKVITTFGGYAVPGEWRISKVAQTPHQVISALCAANNSHAAGPLLNRVDDLTHKGEAEPHPWRPK